MRHVAVLVLVAACQHVAVTARPTELARHVDELHGSGYAEVESDQGGTVRVRADDHISFTFAGNEKSHLFGLFKTGKPDETRQLTVESFLANCGRDGNGPDCLVPHTRGSIAVGSQRRLSAGYLVMGLFGAVATSVALTCALTCSNNSGWAWVGAGIGLVVFLVPLSTVY